MVRQKDPWWRLQDLVNDETRVAVHDEFIIRIDQAIKELEELKKEKPKMNTYLLAVDLGYCRMYLCL